MVSTHLRILTVVCFFFFSSCCFSCSKISFAALRFSPLNLLSHYFGPEYAARARSADVVFPMLNSIPLCVFVIPKADENYFLHSLLWSLWGGLRSICERTRTQSGRRWVSAYGSYGPRPSRSACSLSRVSSLLRVPFLLSFLLVPFVGFESGLAESVIRRTLILPSCARRKRIILIDLKNND